MFDNAAKVKLGHTGGHCDVIRNWIDVVCFAGFSGLNKLQPSEFKVVQAWFCFFGTKVDS